MLHWRELVTLTDEQLGRLDIAEVNLACAEGLPGAEIMDVPLCLRTLDRWATQVREYTEPRFERRFKANPAEFNNSEAYFRCLCLITVLQRDLGVRYNPAKIPLEAKLGPADMFLFGIIQGQGGTCASLPVVWAAVGRRLGYPIKLVSTMGERAAHLFARWDDPKGERLNIEASAHGLSCPTDEEFRRPPYQLMPRLEQLGHYLVSKSVRGELSCFVTARAFSWFNLGRLEPAVDCFLQAWNLAPNGVSWGAAADAMCRWHDGLTARTPRGFPDVRCIRTVGRRFPRLPLDGERDYLYCKVREAILNDPRNAGWLARLRRTGWQPGLPTEAQVQYLPENFTINLVGGNRPPRSWVEGSRRV